MLTIIRQLFNIQLRMDNRKFIKELRGFKGKKTNDSTNAIKISLFTERGEGGGSEVHDSLRLGLLGLQLHICK